MVFVAIRSTECGGVYGVEFFGARLYSIQQQLQLQLQLQLFKKKESCTSKYFEKYTGKYLHIRTNTAHSTQLLALQITLE